jgi:hypothetical protein
MGDATELTLADLGPVCQFLIGCQLALPTTPLDVWLPDHHLAFIDRMIVMYPDRNQLYATLDRVFVAGGMPMSPVLFSLRVVVRRRFRMIAKLRRADIATRYEYPLN